jgi:hypothetical protein
MFDELPYLVILAGSWTQHTCLVLNRVAGYKSYLVKLSFPRLLIRSASPTTVLSTKRCHRGGLCQAICIIPEAEEIFICSI